MLPTSPMSVGRRVSRTCAILVTWPELLVCFRPWRAPLRRKARNSFAPSSSSRVTLPPPPPASWGIRGCFGRGSSCQRREARFISSGIFCSSNWFGLVSRKIALLAAFVMLVGCAIQAVTALLYLAPWVILENGSSMGGFTSQQIQSLAFMFWKLNGRSDQFYVVFFGLWCFLTGYLIFRSTFMPKVIGILLSIDGLGWMMFVFTF